MGSGERAVTERETTRLRVPSPRRPAGQIREQLLDAAARITVTEGWSAVTMVRLAAEVEVSRQTVYNDIGTKADLAEAMTMREVERFLDCVTEAFGHSRTLLVAIEKATRAVLERANDNPLMHAIVSATHGADTELLPYLTNNSRGLLGFCCELVRENLDRFDHDLDPRETDVAVESVVRMVLSHVMQPSASPAQTSEDVAWVAGRILRLG